MNFKGANITDITKINQEDVFRKTSQTIVGMVTVPAAIVEAGEALKVGTLLHTSDGGKTWTTKPATFDTSADTDDIVYYEGHLYKCTADDNTELPSTTTNWEDLGAWNPNGILYNDITESKKTTVVLTSNAKEKYLTGFDEFLRTQLFNNKLIIE